MKRSLQIINGLSVMVLSAIGIILITTNHFVDAQTASKPPQPKITTIKSTHKASRGQTIKTFSWPAQAGKVVALESSVTHIQITPTIQRGLKQPTYWAFRYVWSDEQPNSKNILSDAKNIAATYFTDRSFVTRANSPLIAINAANNRGRYLTVYTFATNNDSVTAAPNFPLGIDYAAAITFRVSQEVEAPSAPEKKSDSTAPKPEMPVKSSPAPAPENDDWSQMETTMPGYKQ